MIALADLQRLITAALHKAGASLPQAAAAARALVAADACGLASHGAARVPSYAAHLRHGRVVGDAVPAIVAERGGTVLIDAACGFAFLACEWAVQQAIERAGRHGIALAAVTNSHHFGVAAHHLMPMAKRGLVGVALGNSPAAMPAWGGKRALFGTNPIAAVFPRRAAPPVVIDLALSEVARGKIMVAAKQGKPIPLGWAVDRDGRPTTDAAAALDGSMLPAGGVKGAMLALMVELLVTALTGAQFGAEADSFFVDEGNRPRLGQAFFAVDPAALAGSGTYFDRVEALLAAMLADDGVRLPGARRDALVAKAEVDGVALPEGLLAQLEALAG